MVRTSLAIIGRRIEQVLVGPMPEDVRRNVRIETFSSLAYGIFYAMVIAFLPVVLRRMGASSTMLAIYTAQTYLGSILSTFGVLLMRRRRPMSFAAACWLIGRSLLVLTFLVSEASWLLVLTALFWLLESMPAPAYARIVQAIYPVQYRGRALSVVRVGMVLVILVATPLAGFGLDTLGYHILFPIAAALAVTSTLLFTRLRINEDTLPPLQVRSFRNIWSILGHNRRFTLYLVSFSIYGLGYLMSLPFLAIVQVDRLHLSYSEIGYLGLVQSLFWLFGNMFWGSMVDKHSGVWVLRANIAIALLVPFCYIWAFNAWTLLPAFIAQGLISAGMDLGVLSTGIELADADSVVEYSAVQATIIGARGVIAPFVGIGLMALGLALPMIFAIGCVLIIAGWLCMGLVTTKYARITRAVTNQ